jgi:hypothetical protein
LRCCHVFSSHRTCSHADADRHAGVPDADQHGDAHV